MALLVGLFCVVSFISITMVVGWTIKKALDKFVTAEPKDDDGVCMRALQVLKCEGPMVSGMAFWGLLFVIFMLGFALFGVGYMFKDIMGGK